MLNSGTNSNIIGDACKFINTYITGASTKTPVNIFLIGLNLFNKITLNLQGLNSVLTLTNQIKEEIRNITKDKNCQTYFISVNTILLITTAQNKNNQLSEEFISLAESYKFSETNPIHLSITVSHYEVTKNDEDPIIILENILDALSETNPDKNTLVKSFKQLAPKAQHELMDKVKQTHYLKEKIKNNEVLFVYQPVYNVKASQVEYYECLMRIQDNNYLHTVGPYVSTAEELSLGPLIDAIAIELLQKTLLQYPNYKFAFNLTANIIENHALLNKIKLLFANKDYARRVHIEITETSKPNSLAAIIDFTKSLKDLNIKFSLDDFGAGYTSFYQLKQIAMDVIKIDGSFIQDILTNKVSQNFVKAILNITKDTNIIVVAEFVESKEIYDYLVSLGINYMQGYYFGQPHLVPQILTK